MSEKEVQGSLNDVDSLNDIEKEQLADGCYVAANDVTTKKGKARKVRVKITDRNGYELELVGINKNIEPKPYPTAEDKLKTIGLSEKVSKDLKDKIKDGYINSNHITDIQKLTLTDNLVELDSKSQDKAVKAVIENRNERNQINSEEISSYILRSGYKDTFTVETWYRGMLRLIQKLNQHASINEEIVTRLSKQQQTTIKNEVRSLIKTLEKFL